ncbi:hypothetical protein KAR91_75500 [Candidatus Pacearchaeota archaeon]|nr:hypothetical protein [Candidatus Pacearchaeota archaeon]
MSIFKNFDWSFKSIAKIVGLALLGIVVFMIVIALIAFSFRTIFQGTNNYEQAYYNDYDRDGVMMESVGSSVFNAKLSMPPIPEPGFSTGDDAENFEVKTYNGTIKTRKLDQTCGKIEDLKSRDEVIFETSNRNEDSCNFSFKVKKESEAEILEVIEKLKPENLNQNTQTIKGTIEAYDKQLEILEKNLISIEETLEKAQDAYDEVGALATRKQDVESLATIIDNKLKLIERLTNERIQIKGQIDRYNQNKADQMERLNYSFFNINVYKDLIFDWKEIKDSWKWELKALVRNVNEVIQGISVNLITYMIRFAQVAIYFFISVFLLKFAWMATRRIWQGKSKRKR